MKSFGLFFLALLCIGFITCAEPSNLNKSAGNSIGSSPSVSPSLLPTTPNIEPASTPRPDEVKQDKQQKFEGTSGITDQKASFGRVAVLTAVRIGQHLNYDRIVFEYSGSSQPGYHIEYIDKPVRSCGSGEVVPLIGDGWLEIRMSPAAAHTEQGQSTVKTRAFAPNLPIVRELKSTCDFEADVTWVAGVTSPNKYRVLELNDPTRLVVDIVH